MSAQQNLYDLQMERFERFKAQDPKNDLFDVVFEIQTKKLYAHKFILYPISTTFESMLSDRWMTKSDEPLKIEGYSFDDFKNFLTFIYSGECQLSDENIVSMVDIAEFYGVNVFKRYCERFLMQLNPGNIFRNHDLANKYSMMELLKHCKTFIINNCYVISKSEQFQNLQKTDLQNIVQFAQMKHEELFEAVYKWAENRGIRKLRVNNAIKEELNDLLSFFKFSEMNAKFFNNFVLKKSFLFSKEEMERILLIRKKVTVKIINVKNGKKLIGEFQFDEKYKTHFLDICVSVPFWISNASLSHKTRYKVIDDIKAQRNFFCGGYSVHYWRTRHPQPSTPCKLIENRNVDWYLVYDSDGDLGVKLRQDLLLCDYLLAEMSAEDGFKLNNFCKIEVHYFA